MRLLFFEIYKRGLWRARSMALSKHVIKYGTQSGFPYCNLTTPPSYQRVPPIRYLGMR